MRIKALSYFLEGHLQPHKLENSTVVIDGQMVYFNLYKNSGIPFAFGAESDRFANYVRTYLDKFKKANVKCYFVFKGGHENKRMLDIRFGITHYMHGRDYDPGNDYDDIVKPLFTKQILFQVLDEMDFEYVVCNDDYIMESIALARKLSCPIIGFNIQYFFSKVPYIPEPKIVLDEDDLPCGITTLSSVLCKLKLTEEKIILFIMLTDRHIFDESVFMTFFEYTKIPLGNMKRLISLLRWLSQNNNEQAQKKIFQFLAISEQAEFLEKKSELENFVHRRQNAGTKMSLYASDKSKAEITQCDPDWFEKGLFQKHIALLCVNLYRFQVVQASALIEDYEQENSIMLSIDIIKYAFDLLTNFNGSEIYIQNKLSVSDDGEDSRLTYNNSIRKPHYDAALSVFESGWNNIKDLNLFEHFFIDTFQSFAFDRLDGAPADAKLLLIAIVYYARKKPEVKLEIYSILLSYVMLGVVSEKKTDGCNHSSVSASDKPLPDALTDKSLVSSTDCNIAWSIMRKYFETRRDEICYLFDRKAIHPLVEFQHCLLQVNNLNQLCGSPYDGTVYSKTYNGTFVYKVLYSMRGLDGFEFIKIVLNPAPTVLAFLCGLVEIYESIMYEI